jgi:hypothetical protein
MATFNKIYAFVEDVAEKVHNLGSDTLKVALSNTAPTTASTVWSVANFPAPAAANGYTAGGNTPAISSSAQTTGTYKLTLADTVFTATAGGIGPFRYAILYNDTAASDQIIGWYDYGSSITLNDTETLTVDFDVTNGVLTIA